MKLQNPTKLEYISLFFISSSFSHSLFLSLPLSHSFFSFLSFFVLCVFLVWRMRGFLSFFVICARILCGVCVRYCVLEGEEGGRDNCLMRCCVLRWGGTTVLCAYCLMISFFPFFLFFYNNFYFLYLNP